MFRDYRLHVSEIEEREKERKREGECVRERETRKERRPCYYSAERAFWIAPSKQGNYVSSERLHLKRSALEKATK